MTKLHKNKIQACGITAYLLGRDKNGTNYYLQKPIYACGSFCAFGNIITFSNNAKPKQSKRYNFYQYFSKLIFDNQQRFYTEIFKDFFVDTPLNEEEIYILVEYMKTCYTLDASVSLFEKGYSFYTTKETINTFKNKELVKIINQDYLATLFEKLDKLLSPKE